MGLSNSDTTSLQKNVGTYKANRDVIVFLGLNFYTEVTDPSLLCSTRSSNFTSTTSALPLCLLSQPGDKLLNLTYLNFLIE
jgi:hypothetical protein